MTLDLSDPALAPLLDKLGPHARVLLDRTVAHALRLHADVVTPEHLLSTLMTDEECAAHAAVLHAFADPPTIADEALAISPGWMVVASGSTLPFSARAAAALVSATSRAARDGAEEVGLETLISEAEAALEPDLQSALRAAGYGGAPSTPSTADAGPTPSRRFSPAAKRTLSAANRLAASEKASAISPAHLFLAGLAEGAASAPAAGITFPKARGVLAGRTADRSVPADRLLTPDPSLVRFLTGLPAGADTLALLLRFHGGDTPELAAILNRSKVNGAFLERAQGSFRDPD
jgi:ATP-dependent Clp protease ATP-binding subunit ClpA